MKVVLATGNAGKVAEISRIFSETDIELIAQSDLDIESPPETGDTFVENALIKARHAASQTGLPAMADDSGLAVEALGGRPGVHSARYAGDDATDEENVDLLLRELANVDVQNRNAGFHCAAVFVSNQASNAPLICEAVWQGRITETRQGDGGFGYDPVFFDPEIGKTGAQMNREEKNSISHRGRAFQKLCALLQKQ